MSYEWTVNNMLRGDTEPGHFPEDELPEEEFEPTDDAEPSHDDTVLCCPDCETPLESYREAVCTCGHLTSKHRGVHPRTCTAFGWKDIGTPESPDRSWEPCDCEGFEEKPNATEDFISKHNAAVICRVLIRLHQQVTLAFQEGRDDDARALARLSGAVHYRIFGKVFNELEAA